MLCRLPSGHVDWCAVICGVQRRSSPILVFPYSFGVYYLRKQWEIACYVWSRAVMMARYALPRVLSRPSAVSGGGPRVTVGGPDFNPSHALHQRVKSEDKGSLLHRDNRWLWQCDAVFKDLQPMGRLGFYQWWLSSVRGGTTLSLEKIGKMLEIPIYFPSFRSRPC